MDQVLVSLGRWKQERTGWGQPGLLSWLVVLGVAVLGWSRAGGVLAQDEPPRSPAVFTSQGTMNFQGELTDTAGTPLNGSYDMRFALYDAGSGGSKPWPPGALYEEHLAIPVSKGLFTVQLGSGYAMDATVFNNGGDRHLQIWICATGTGCTIFDDLGRLPVSSAAYAQTLHLPAALEDSASGYLLSVTNSSVSGQGGVYGRVTATTGGSAGLFGQSDSVAGSGVLGWATASSGTAFGVLGQTASSSGRGIYGYAYNSSGNNIGVYGRSDGTGGSGLFGLASATSGSTHGVYGQSNSNGGTGIYGAATATSGTTIGVEGESNSPTGYGLFGFATASTGTNYGVAGQSNSTAGRAVYGLANATSGTTYAVYGQNNSTAGRGVYGIANATSGTTFGVYGESSSSSGRGVYGLAAATTGTTTGVFGQSDSTSGTGIFGVAGAASGTTYGVYGLSSSTTGRGVNGFANATSGTTYGVYGQSNSSSGRGVYGLALATTGTTFGLYGESESSGGRGVYGLAEATTGVTYGVLGQSDSTAGSGVFGLAGAASGTTTGVYGLSSSTAGRGVFGFANSSSGDTYGVYGQSSSNFGTGVYGRATATGGATFGTGVFGWSDSGGGYGVTGVAPNNIGVEGGGVVGVRGTSDDTSGYGVYGWNLATTGTPIGVYGAVSIGGNSPGYAGYFNGRVRVVGDFAVTGGKSFLIDHPLDPANQYLYHYNLEGPEPFNVYRGTAILDANGQAWAQLPAYFETINRDFHYLLTPVGAAMPNLHIAAPVITGVSDNQFKISGGVPGGQVSWLVTAVRNDPWMRDNGFETETAKPEGEQGTYLYPEGYGQPVEAGLSYQHQMDSPHYYPAAAEGEPATP
jgi:hypothetical protein